MEQELENTKLKKRISELEDSLSPRPLFAEPLSIMVPETTPQDTPGTSTRVKRVAKLLSGVRMYIVENINKRLTTILEVWEVGTNLRNLSQRISTLITIYNKTWTMMSIFIKML
jgi:hypothetical protein